MDKIGGRRSWCSLDRADRSPRSETNSTNVFSYADVRCVSRMENRGTPLVHHVERSRSTDPPTKWIMSVRRYDRKLTRGYVSVILSGGCTTVRRARVNLTRAGWKNADNVGDTIRRFIIIVKLYRISWTATFLLVVYFITSVFFFFFFTLFLLYI